MAWNDGITEEVSEFLNSVASSTSRSRLIGEQVIDTEVKEFSSKVEPRIPYDTGGLQSAYTVDKETDKRWYGYSVGFKGNAPNGEPYQKIANVLNYGTPHIAGTFFITNAIKGLKGMTDRINARIDAELDSSVEK